MVNKKSYFALFLVAYLICATAASVQNAQVNQRIVNGTSVGIGRAPFFVRIIIDGRLLCGGSLVNVKRVVTAGHCVDGKSSFLLNFGYISDKLSTLQQFRFAKRSDVILHPNFNRRSLANDIAIIKFDQPVTFSRFVGLVQIGRAIVNENTQLIAIGGGLNGDRKRPNVLQWVNQVSISNADCAKAYNRTSVLPTVVCTRGLYGKEATCNGDSGSPLIHQLNGRPQLVGVSSFGGGSLLGCHNGLPSGFTRISNHLQFIDKSIKSN